MADGAPGEPRGSVAVFVGRTDRCADRRVRVSRAHVRAHVAGKWSPVDRSRALEATRGCLSSEWNWDFAADGLRSYRVDMYDLAALSDVLDEIAAEETVHVLVNNAYELGPNTGFNTPDGALETATLDQWTRHFTSGVYWPALTVQKLGPGMVARQTGSIVNISTMYALVAPDPRLYEGTDF